MKRFFLSISLLFSFLCTFAQQYNPKFEFRAAWIATVSNIDWPSKPGLPAETQRQEYLRLLNVLQSLGFNAVIVQIRPSADALYDSPHEAWSRYLTGKQGVAPNPYYDPLVFMIDEAHKRNMEFHAWFNPYRALTDANKNPNPPGHITHTRPDWFLKYGGKMYFDPGIPEVMEYITKIVKDVVHRYDVDAIHFDDYFYPYRIPNVEFPDYASYRKYGQAFISKDEWRRDNVNTVIQMISKVIKAEKPWVKFGISPFGVWRNQSQDPDGSPTRGGQTNYDDLYADVLLWLKKGWIDYNLPQLYWERGHKAVAYEILLDWWSKHTYGRHVYIGHGLYRLNGATAGPWANPRELPEQIRMLRQNKQVKGSAFYSAIYFLRNLKGFNDSLQNNLYNTPALVPPMPWIDSIAPTPPQLKVSHQQGNTVLQWTSTDAGKEPLRYIVYRFKKDEPINLANPGYIMTITTATQMLDNTRQANESYQYIVTALDRINNESRPSNFVKH